MKRDIDLEPWRHYLAAFDAHLKALKAWDHEAARLTRLLMRYELFRQYQPTGREPTYRTRRAA